ncbi:MAG: hypothetical protein ACC656_15135, partial [Candidatus Heimdallarchaeota archaeon]
KVTIGDSIEGFDTKLIDVKFLELRSETGDLLSKSEFDDSVKIMVDGLIKNGKKVLLHLLDCSKTGLGGPSMELICELKIKYQNLFHVIVDAAQMRIGNIALQKYIESNFMVLITGSKFFTGAPFSGALIVPPSIANDIDELQPLPSGLSAYGTIFDFPFRWKALSKNMNPRPNFGLLLRWQSALWEMKAFFSVSALEQFNTINSFGQAMLKMIEENANTDLVLAPLHDRGYPPTTLSWDQLPTIFTFLVNKEDLNLKSKKILTYEEARFAYKCINMDIARFLPVQASNREHLLAEKRCHIGQPVRIRIQCGEWIGALRIAAGASLVSGVKFDNALGSTGSERLAT